MSGRLSGLRDALKAERQPPAPAPRPTPSEPELASVAVAGASRAKARIGKRALAGYFSPELVRAVNIEATQRDTTVQAILGEALDLWFRENGKHPFGER